MNRKARLKILERLAQTTTTTTTTSGTQGSTTPQQGATAVTPAATDWQGMYGQVNLTAGWDSSRFPYINGILHKLDAAANTATGGQVNLGKMWPTFPAGVESDFQSPTKDLVLLLKKAYQQFLNGSKPFTQKLTSDEVKKRVGALLNAQELAKLEQINPTGPIGQANVSLGTIRAALTAMMPPS